MGERSADKMPPRQTCKGWAGQCQFSVLRSQRGRMADSSLKSGRHPQASIIQTYFCIDFGGNYLISGRCFARAAAPALSMASPDPCGAQHHKISKWPQVNFHRHNTRFCFLNDGWGHVFFPARHFMHRDSMIKNNCAVFAKSLSCATPM